MQFTEQKLIKLDELCGTAVHPTASMDKVIRDAGLEFEIERVPAYSPEGAQLSTMQWVRNPDKAKRETEPFIQKKVPLFFILRRADNKKVLGMVRKRYTPIPVQSMLQPFNQMVKEFKAVYETAGLINGGAKLWVAAKLPDAFHLKQRPQDVIQNRIMLLLDQSGLRRNAFFTMNVRVFCNNQFHMIAKSAREAGCSVKHSKNWEAYLTSARHNFEMALRNMEDFQKTADQLDDMEMSIQEMYTFASLLLPAKDEEQTNKRTENRREELSVLFENGKGNLGKTRWDAFNAVTEFMDHHSSINRGKSGTQEMQQASRERRLVSNLLGGPGDLFKHRALNILLKAKKFTPAQAAAALN